ncbi:uncharacterized protein LOC104937408 [Larimichthys crocea]|uniref:uncharacterized protein LOC104937408 n=1 Tax=Larimichthys crocea TaxID=215358 RepID=UPI000900D208|nr:uncharacterized protein LOC104937408 [Larimichthys crocea]
MLRMKCVAVVGLLSLLSMGHSAPLSGCDSLIKPISVSSEDILGSWLYIGGSSDLPGTRSLGRLMTSVSLNVTATAQSNILNIVQAQRVYGQCSKLVYNVTFENSTMSIEQPFYLKEGYLPTDCSDCLVAYEEITAGKDKFTSLLLFSRRKSVSAADVEMLRRQAECLQMPSPMIIDTNYEICQDNMPSLGGLTAFHSLLENKVGQRIARLLDSLFDMFVN